MNVGELVSLLREMPVDAEVSYEDRNSFLLPVRTVELESSVEVILTA